MAEQIKNLIAKWDATWPSPLVVSRQHDNGQFRINLVDYPEPENYEDQNEEIQETINYYLVVWMKQTEDGEMEKLAPIQLPGPYWLVNSPYTQLVQDIKFQFYATSSVTGYIAHSAQFKGMILESLSGSQQQSVIPEDMWDAYKQYIEDKIIGAGLATIDPTLSISGAAADAKATGDAITNVNGRLDELGQGGVGWTSEQKSAVLAIARAVAYKTENGDQLYSDLYDALYAVRIRYTIANTLTHCTSNNNATSIMEGYNYSAVITPSSGYELSSVQIMMGGVNITASAYKDGTINISEVTGNVAITATATKILPDGYTALEYVTADGNQYINTGIAETEIISAEYDFSLNADSRYGTGNHILSSANVFMPFLRSTYTESDHARNLMVCNRGQSAGTETAFQWSLNRRYAFKAFMGGTNNIVIDNAQVATIPVGNNLSAENSLYLFAYGGRLTNGTYRFNGNLYSMRIYNSSGTLIHRYLPCLNSNNVAGLYDTVSQTFLHSESGTELIAGGAA